MLANENPKGIFMNYYQEVIYDTLQGMRIRAITTRIRDDHQLKDLCDYLKEHEVDMFYEELNDGTLPQSVIDQYGLFCDIIQEIVQ